MNSTRNGYLYIYVERLIAEIPEDRQVFLHLSFLYNEKDIFPVKQVENQFLFLKKYKIEATYEISIDDQSLQTIKLTIRLFSLTVDGKRHLHAEFASGLHEAYNVNELSVSGYEMRSKMTEKPVICLAYGLLDDDLPAPHEFELFKIPRPNSRSLSSNRSLKRNLKSHASSLSDIEIGPPTLSSGNLVDKYANQINDSSFQNPTCDEIPTKARLRRASLTTKKLAISGPTVEFSLSQTGSISSRSLAKPSGKRKLRFSSKSNSTANFSTQSGLIQSTMVRSRDSWHSASNPGLLFPSDSLPKKKFQKIDTIEEIHQILDLDFAQHSTSPCLEQFLLHIFLNIRDYDYTEPGALLLQYLKENHIIQTNDLYRELFSILNAIQTDSQTTESSIRYYANAVYLWAQLKAPWTKQLFQNAEKTVIQKSTPFLYLHFREMLRNENSGNSHSAKKHGRSFLKHFYSFNPPFSKYVMNELIINEIDCKVSNSIILDNFITTFEQAMTANTILTDFETKSKLNFPRFRQCLLIILACETILDDPKEALNVGPLISPNFVYFILAGIQPDDNFPGAEYKKIKNFVEVMQVDLRKSKEDTIFVCEPHEPPCFLLSTDESTQEK